jgi:hypothetical protein
MFSGSTDDNWGKVLADPLQDARSSEYIRFRNIELSNTWSSFSQLVILITTPVFTGVSFILLARNKLACHFLLAFAVMMPKREYKRIVATKLVNKKMEASTVKAILSVPETHKVCKIETYH